MAMLGSVKGGALPEDFSGLVRERHRLACSVHGDLGIPLDVFEANLRRIAERYLGPGLSEQSLVEFVRSLHTNDLVLSLSCAVGSEKAWQRFSSLYCKYLADLCRHLLGRSQDLDELGKTIWIDLFLRDRSGQSRIASYDGRSSLATWLRVVVSNRIINERQRRSATSGNLDAIPEPADPRAHSDVEGQVAQERYHAMILSVFRRSLREFTDREILLVLLRYDQGLQLGQIARMFSVHQSTITRQLERIVERLRNDVRTLLETQFGLDREQVDECLTVACDTFARTESILRLLKERSRGDPSSIAYS